MAGRCSAAATTLPCRHLPHHHSKIHLRQAGGICRHAGLQAQPCQGPPHNGARQHQVIGCKLGLGDGRGQRLAHLRNGGRGGRQMSACHCLTVSDRPRCIPRSSSQPDCAPCQCSEPTDLPASSSRSMQHHGIIPLPHLRRHLILAKPREPSELRVSQHKGAAAQRGNGQGSAESMRVQHNKLSDKRRASRPWWAAVMARAPCSKRLALALQFRLPHRWLVRRLSTLLRNTSAQNSLQMNFITSSCGRAGGQTRVQGTRQDRWPG